MIAKISAAIGIIGAADGPTTLYVANYFKLEKFIAHFGGSLRPAIAGADHPAAGHPR